MEFGREKLKQIRHLMLLAALLVLGIIYSQQVFWGVGFLVRIITPFLAGGAIAFVLNIPMKAFEEKLLGRWRGKGAGSVKRPLFIMPLFWQSRKSRCVCYKSDRNTALYIS